MKGNYEKRRFVEAMCLAMTHAQMSRGTWIGTRQMVNRAIEVADEIEHQLPTKEDDRD